MLASRFPPCRVPCRRFYLAARLPTRSYSVSVLLSVKCGPGHVSRHLPWLSGPNAARHPWSNTMERLPFLAPSPAPSPISFVPHPCWPGWALCWLHVSRLLLLTSATASIAACFARLFAVRCCAELAVVMVPLSPTAELLMLSLGVPLGVRHLRVGGLAGSPAVGDRVLSHHVGFPLPHPCGPG